MIFFEKHYSKANYSDGVTSDVSGGGVFQNSNAVTLPNASILSTVRHRVSFVFPHPRKRLHSFAFLQRTFLEFLYLTIHRTVTLIHVPEILSASIIQFLYGCSFSFQYQLPKQSQIINKSPQFVFK